MTKCIRILLASFILTLTSCIQLKLYKKYKKYSPYKENDILVFQSQKNASTDTFIIYNLSGVKIERRCKGIAFNTKKYICEGFSSFILDYYPYTKKEYSNSKQRIHLFEIIPHFMSYEKNTCEKNGIKFSLSFPNHYFLDYFINLKVFNQQELQRFDLNDKTFTDVLEISPQFKYGATSPHMVTKFYWSKSCGYLKIITMEGEVFTIINHFNDPITVKKTVEDQKKIDDLWDKQHSNLKEK